LCFSVFFWASSEHKKQNGDNKKGGVVIGEKALSWCGHLARISDQPQLWGDSENEK